MTEKSYFWETDAFSPLGDDIYSPYDATEFNSFMHTFVEGDANDADPGDVITRGAAFVVPDYLENLDVVTLGTGFHSIVVKTGAALVHNIYYVQDTALTIPIDKPSALSHRFDAVVLEHSPSNDTVRVKVLTGPELLIASGFPSIPVLTETPVLWQVMIAVIYVSASNTYIPVGHIYDYRKFLYTGRSRTDYPAIPANLLRNGGWMAHNGTTELSEWATDGSYSLAAFTDITNIQRFSRTHTTPSTFSQYIRVGGTKTFSLFTFVGENLPLTGQSITVGIRGFRENGQESVLYKEHRYVTSSSVSGEWITITITFPEDDILYLYVYYTFASGSTERVYPIYLVEGFYPRVYFREINEVLLHTTPLTDANWTATAKSTSGTLINLISDFGANTENNTKAVMLRVRARDSGSAGAANCYLRILGVGIATYGIIQLEGVTNDVWREMQVIVPVNQIYTKTGVNGAQFNVDIVATGAATFDVTIEVVGLIV